jgi:hypothetical protein
MKRLLIAFAFLSGTLYTQNSVEMFKFTTDYYFLDLKGNLGQRQQIIGSYIRDLSAKKVRWMDITIANSAKDSPDLLLPAQKSQAMNGFSYALGAGDISKAEFFRDVPSATMQERNLVWDTRMFEIFAEDHFDQLELNKPFHVPGPTNIPLAGAGTFQNKDAQLILSGTSTCDEGPCAVVDYRAFFNTFEVRTGKETLVGRSHYWGQVWVSTSTKRILRGTLYEDVLGEVTSEASARPQPVNVFRIGTFERMGR